MKNKTKNNEEANHTEPEENVSELAKYPKSSNSSAFWAVLVITAGLIFLLNNFNLLPWSVWENIWRFWPLILIFWGLQLFFGKNWWSNLLISVIGLLVIIGVISISIATVNKDFDSWAQNNFGWWSQIRRVYSSDEVSNLLIIPQSEFQNITERKMRIEMGSAKFSINDIQSNDYLRIEALYPKGIDEPRLVRNQEGNILDIEFDAKGMNHMFLGFGDRAFDFKLGHSEIPTSFDIDLGSGTGRLNFQNLRVPHLKIDTGSGNLDISFSQTALPTQKAEIDLGSGQINIDIPDETGVQLNYKIGSGEIIVKDQSLTGNGKFMSPNFDTAPSRLILEIEIGSGTLKIK